MDAGRWTILARATPQPRRRSPPHLRARVHVRCVCGLAHTVWLEDIEQGRSTGCSSRRCFARYQASHDLRAALTRFIDREHEALVALAQRADAKKRASIVRLADALYGEKLAAVDAFIVEWLRRPLDADLELGALSHG